MRRLRRSCFAGGAILVWAMSAEAQEAREGFAVGRYEPAERGADWFVVDALDLRARPSPTVGATVDHAYKPLVVYDAGGNERAALVRHQLLAHLGASFVLGERIRIAASVPLALYQDGESAVVGGETLMPAKKTALSDLRLAADVRIAGRYRAPISLAVGLRAWLPTGSRAQFTSDGSIRLGPQVLASGELGVFAWAARAALVYRPGAERYAGTALEGELLFAGGAGVRVGRWLFGPELSATTALDRPFGARETPVDVLLGAHHRTASGLAVSIAIGSGLTRGYGSPAVRALLALEWGSPIPDAPGDRDKDGIVDPVDACPDWAGIPSAEPETHGCPPPERVPDEDADGDQVWDRDDACPAVPGARSRDPMLNGCPPGTPRPLAIVTKTEIRIAEQVRFTTGSADLVESDALLEAVRRLLADNPNIRKLRVEGHTDDIGDPSFNDDLSARRATSVVTWLTDHGIDPARLETKGHGSREPLDGSHTDEARAKNRRVVFVIVTRAP